MDLTGQIGLIPRGHFFVAEGIEWITHSPVYHVIVCVGDGLIVEAKPSGARLGKIAERPTAIWSQYNLTPEQAQGCAGWARSHVGTPYNFLDDAAIGMGCLLKHATPNFIEKRLSSDKHLQCAQLADAALTKGAGIKVFDDGRLDGAVYPGSFVPLFQANGWWPPHNLS